jgi:GntR family transcriptional regulator/MocR family aminotransferase
MALRRDRPQLLLEFDMARDGAAGLPLRGVSPPNGSPGYPRAIFIDEGWFARHVRKMSATYRARHQLLTSVLARDFSDQLEVIPSAAGLHVTAIARASNAEQLSAIVRRASDAGVEVQQLSAFAHEGPPPAGLVLGYGAISTSHIEEGLGRLRSCFMRP